MLRLMLQLAVILVSCRVVGWLGKKYFGQTQVVMEMLAGVMLGPSLLGAVWPQVQQWLFPKFMTIGGHQFGHPSMSILYCLSQLGLVFYMFLIGLEFDAALLRDGAKKRGDSERGSLHGCRHVHHRVSDAGSNPLRAGHREDQDGGSYPGRRRQ